MLYVLTEHNILCCTFTTPRWVAEFPHHSGGTAANAGQKLHWSWPRVQHEYRWRLRLPCFWSYPQQFLQCLYGLDPVLCHKTKQGGHTLALTIKCLILETWLLLIRGVNNKVHELIAVKVLHTSLLNTTVVAFKVLSLWSYALMPAPSPPFKTILELLLWNDLQSCLCITPDVISVIKMPSFQYFLYLREQKKVVAG